MYRPFANMKMLANAGAVTLKNHVFSNGTIEFDLEPIAGSFSGIYFRQMDDKEDEFF